MGSSNPRNIDNWQNAEAIQALVNHGRSPTELIVKSVAIHFACLVAVAHLGSLRRLPIRVQIYECVGFILVPLLPCAQILVGISQAIQKYRAQRASNPFGWKYYVCAALYVHVVPEDQEEAAFPLLIVDPGRHLAEDVLACKPVEPSKTRWLMRMIPLILLIAEASWGSFLWIRRIRFSKYNAPTFSTPSCGNHNCDIVPYADSFLDHLNAAAVIGGFGTAVASLMIRGLNCSWTCSQRMAREATGSQERATQRITGESLDRFSEAYTHAFLEATGASQERATVRITGASLDRFLKVTGPSQERATLRITAESLDRFSGARTHGFLLASVLQIAVEYRVLELFVLPIMKELYGDLFKDDRRPLMLYQTFSISVVYLLTPLVMFAMSFVFLFRIELPRGLRKWFQPVALTYLYFGPMAIYFRVYFISSAVTSFRDLLGCSPGGNGSCRAPFLLWADPLSHKFLTIG